MKQNSEFSRELCCREAKNIIFCKILCIFRNSAQFTRFCEKFRWRSSLSWSIDLAKLNPNCHMNDSIILTEISFFPETSI